MGSAGTWSGAPPTQCPMRQSPVTNPTAKNRSFNQSFRPMSITSNPFPRVATSACNPPLPRAATSACNPPLPRAATSACNPPLPRAATSAWTSHCRVPPLQLVTPPDRLSDCQHACATHQNSSPVYNTVWAPMRV
eukprot:365872-Chlamydomonas_euryale.AAC.1